MGLGMLISVSSMWPALLIQACLCPSSQMTTSDVAAPTATCNRAFLSTPKALVYALFVIALKASARLVEAITWLYAPYV